MMWKRKISKMLAFLMLIMPTSALSDAVQADVVRGRVAGSTVGLAERDPTGTMDCLSLGALDIVFRTGNDGPPNISVVLTDPWGRRIGFDPLIKQAWQQLPAAEGDIDCDRLDNTAACRGVVQVCGPVSGTYKLEVIAPQATTYSMSISARSEEVLEGNGLQSSHSEADLNNVAIRGRSRNIVLLNYSRDPQESVTAQLQHKLQAEGSDAHSHRHPDLEARKK